MKKILLILITGLLWCSVGNAAYPECVTRGAHIGGNKPFKKPFLKFFTENLLN